LKEILEAIKYLGDLDIIHRDIKLENILNQFGKIKLTDFGLARYLKGVKEGKF
jgi:serine/threonine protein kinase